jgi:hypothetical protein
MPGMPLIGNSDSLQRRCVELVDLGKLILGEVECGNDGFVVICPENWRICDSQGIPLSSHPIFVIGHPRLQGMLPYLN